jgi:glycopeptide antibiotics resistance protein
MDFDFLNDYTFLFETGIPGYVFWASFLILCAVISLTLMLCRDVHILRKVITITLLGEYLFIVMCTTVFVREVSLDQKIELTPFWSYFAKPELENLYIFENILNVFLFLPIGFLLGNLKMTSRWWRVLAISLLFSVCIETLQYLLRRGLCETDDVIHNTLGAILGFLILKSLYKFTARCLNRGN